MSWSYVLDRHGVVYLVAESGHEMPLKAMTRGGLIQALKSAIRARVDSNYANSDDADLARVEEVLEVEIFKRMAW